MENKKTKKDNKKSKERDTHETMRRVKNCHSRRRINKEELSSTTSNFEKSVNSRKIFQVKNWTIDSQNVFTFVAFKSQSKSMGMLFLRLDEGIVSPCVPKEFVHWSVYPACR